MFKIEIVMTIAKRTKDEDESWKKSWVEVRSMIGVTSLIESNLNQSKTFTKKCL